MSKFFAIKILRTLFLPNPRPSKTFREYRGRGYLQNGTDREHS
jgi:hypothetical protein